LPWGHAGGNLDESTVKRWAQRELRGKRITNVNTRFDVHMMREWGVDLEQQGNEVSDVAHYAALLDDHRHRMSVDLLIHDYLHEEPMRRLDESQMRYYHAGEAAPRSMYGVEAVKRLKDVMWPMLDEQDLQRVRALEDKVIYVVCEMEKNGSPIDLELLDRWERESAAKLNQYLWELAKACGFQVNPDSPKDQERVFQKFGLNIERTESGRASFTDAILKRIEHPTVQLMRRAGKLASLRSKFLLNTKKVIGSDGILRYALHQLRSTKDELANAGEAGTVTGRFSSSEIASGVGCNIQQRSKPSKQRVSFGYNEKDSSHDDEIFLIRKLHIAGSGLFLASDMAQVEYRLFASYANNPRVIQAYQEDPDLSFHTYIQVMLTPFRPDLTYGKTKDCNFAYVYGAGVKKHALMLGYITGAEFHRLTVEKAKSSHPLLAETAEIRRIYLRELPEVGPLLEEATHLAMPKCASWCNKDDAIHRRFQHRGYVKTLLGRRSRFPDGFRTHKALNSVIQGGAADVMKQKLVELHEQRHETGFTLRATIHDEVIGDIPDLEGAQRVATVLNRQSFPQVRVPLLWETGTGPNWASCSPLEVQHGTIEQIRGELGITDWHANQTRS
jgi:DNA polymerase-1